MACIILFLGVHAWLILIGIAHNSYIASLKPLSVKGQQDGITALAAKLQADAASCHACRCCQQEGTKLSSGMHVWQRHDKHLGPCI